MSRPPMPHVLATTHRSPQSMPTDPAAKEYLIELEPPKRPTASSSVSEPFLSIALLSVHDATESDSSTTTMIMVTRKATVIKRESGVIDSVNHLEFIRPLHQSSSSTSRVWFCVDANNGEERAVKCVQRVPRQHAAAYEFLMTLDHANLPRLYEVIDDPQQSCLFLVKQHIDGAVLGRVDETSGHVTLAARASHIVARVMLDVARALQYLHQRGVAHGAVRPQHVLVENKTSRGFLIDYEQVKHVWPCRRLHDSLRVHSDRQLDISRRSFGGDISTLELVDDDGEAVDDEGEDFVGSLLRLHRLTGAQEQARLPPRPQGSSLPPVPATSLLNALLIPSFIAPELHSEPESLRRRATLAGDMWALGITLYCTLFGQLPRFCESTRTLHYPNAPSTVNSEVDQRRWHPVLDALLAPSPSLRMSSDTLCRALEVMLNEFGSRHV